MKTITLEQHKILTKQPHPNSQAGYILYKKWLEHEGYFSKSKWGIFRHNFLTKKQKQGELRCVYCGRENLSIYFPNDSKSLATIDHIIPRSRGGDRYNEMNLVVACAPCNAKKGDKFPSVETTIWLLLSAFFSSTKTA